MMRRATVTTTHGVTNLTYADDVKVSCNVNWDEQIVTIKDESEKSGKYDGLVAIIRLDNFVSIFFGKPELQHEGQTQDNALSPATRQSN
jgi:hypothetical protein